MPVATIDPGFHFASDYAIGILFVGLALLAAIVVLSRETTVSNSVIYLAIGVVGGLGIEVIGAGRLDPIDDAETVKRLSEIAVIVALFATGMQLDRALRWRAWRSTALLLVVVMPLTIGAVAALGVVGLGLSAGAAIVLGAALAPTDPVLAGELGVGPPGEEDEPEAAFALTSEAGLNDGLAFPFLFLGLVVAGGASAADVAEWLAADVLYAIALGCVMGALGGWGLAIVGIKLREGGGIASDLGTWSAVCAVLVIYGLTEVVGAYGFLAAFVGGIAFRRYERDHERNEQVHGGAQRIERILEFAMIILLGTLLSLSGLGEPGWWGWALAALLILVIRPAACAIGLVGSRLSPVERAYVGWFGVRGIGSLYYGAAAVGSGLIAADEAAAVMWTIIAAVVLSILLHGGSGGPVTRRLERREAQSSSPGNASRSA